MIINFVLAVLGLNIISMIFGLALLVPSISIAARRLHDTGRTGWWQLIALIPLIGIIILIVFLVQDSHDTNEYGVNPKSGELA
ncbi:inner membrane protein yhaH [Paraglaciecola arctica BSs20135]|uniref:Inner membrane protein yhaH n=2 Tax=Paraglaciecola TaxID=1621534 RepID=K6YTE8_9ALTE|nr:inner membrane protein yhaH [Paraglaciecola arctica BSs20135]